MLCLCDCHSRHLSEVHLFTVRENHHDITDDVVIMKNVVTFYRRPPLTILSSYGTRCLHSIYNQLGKFLDQDCCVRGITPVLRVSPVISHLQTRCFKMIDFLVENLSSL